MDHIAHTSALCDKWNGLPVKSDRVFKAQLKHAGVIVGDKEVERRIYTRRVRYLTPISLERLAAYGLHVSIREDLHNRRHEGGRRRPLSHHGRHAAVALTLHRPDA